MQARGLLEAPAAGSSNVTLRARQRPGGSTEVPCPTYSDPDPRRSDACPPCPTPYELEVIQVIDTPEATHIRYRVRR